MTVPHRCQSGTSLPTDWTVNRNRSRSSPTVSGEQGCKVGAHHPLVSHPLNHRTSLRLTSQTLRDHQSTATESNVRHARTAGLVPRLMKIMISLSEPIDGPVGEPTTMTITTDKTTGTLPLIAVTTATAPFMDMTTIVILTTGTGITATMVSLVATYLITCNQMSGLGVQSLSTDPDQQRPIVGHNQQSLILSMKSRTFQVSDTD